MPEPCGPGNRSAPQRSKGFVPICGLGENLGSIWGCRSAHISTRACLEAQGHVGCVCGGCLCTCAPATACPRGAVLPSASPCGSTSRLRYRSVPPFTSVSGSGRCPSGPVCLSLPISCDKGTVQCDFPPPSCSWLSGPGYRPPYAIYLMDGTHAVPGGTRCRPTKRWALPREQIVPSGGRADFLLY